MFVLFRIVSVVFNCSLVVFFDGCSVEIEFDEYVVRIEFIGVEYVVSVYYVNNY